MEKVGLRILDFGSLLAIHVHFPRLRGRPSYKLPRMTPARSCFRLAEDLANANQPNPCPAGRAFQEPITPPLHL